MLRWEAEAFRLGQPCFGGRARPRDNVRQKSPDRCPAGYDQARCAGAPPFAPAGGGSPGEQEYGVHDGRLCQRADPSCDASHSGAAPRADRLEDAPVSDAKQIMIRRCRKEARRRERRERGLPTSGGAHRHARSWRPAACRVTDGITVTRTVSALPYALAPTHSWQAVGSPERSLSRAAAGAAGAA